MSDGMTPGPFGGSPTSDDGDKVIIVGGGGDPSAESPDGAEGHGNIAEMVEQPAKVMRIGTMIKQLLEEVRAAPLDDASRVRLKEIHESSIRELEDGLAPELREELERLALPFTDEGTPSDAELRIAQAQLVGGSKVSSTASRPRCSPSRWRPAPSSNRCVRAPCPRG